MLTTITCIFCNKEYTYDRKKEQKTVRKYCSRSCDHKHYYERNKEKLNRKRKARYYSKLGHDAHLKRTYGISVEEYDLLAAKQNYRCAICDSYSPKDGRSRLCVDHDHTTGAVRGLLCGHCNRALGLLKDSPELLNKASTYLTNHGNNK